MDGAGIASCFTCSVRLPVSQLQAGHFIPRNYLSTRWLEANVKPQCVRCNIFSRGAYPEFANRLGGETVAHLVSLKHKSVKLNRAEIQDQITHLEELLSEFH